VLQKMLIQTLRGPERDGIVLRKVYAVIPPEVEYALTELGRTLVGILDAIGEWSENNIEDVLKARSEYDAGATSEAAPE